MTSPIDYALKYISGNMPVFPLCWPDLAGNCACGLGHTDRSIGKVPLTKNGLQDATLTIQGVREYWERWPKANIGIAIPSGYFVLDVDIEHNGFDSLARMEREHDFDLPPTWLITTGSGGQHYWYKTDKPIRNTARLAGYDGLDIRGQGGYVVAPPSIHRSGLSYQSSPVWPGPITKGPPELINLCFQRLPTPISNNEDSLIYHEGERNDRLTRDAGAMRRRGLSEQAIYAALQITNIQRCQPALPENDVRTIAKSISRYTPETEGKPRFKGAI